MQDCCYTINYTRVVDTCAENAIRKERSKKMNNFPDFQQSILWEQKNHIPRHSSHETRQVFKYSPCIFFCIYSHVCILIFNFWVPIFKRFPPSFFFFFTYPVSLYSVYIFPTKHIRPCLADGGGGRGEGGHGVCVAFTCTS